MILKKIAHEIKVENIGRTSYIINQEGREYGIFFRKPLQRVEVPSDFFYDDDFSIINYAEKMNKNVLYRMWQHIINRKTANDVLAHHKYWATHTYEEANVDEMHYDWEYLDSTNLACITINELVFPVYFTRLYRQLDAKLNNHTSAVKNIHSHGYEGYKNNCAGACEKEVTRIKTLSGTITCRKTDSFHYTYKHIVEEELLDKAVV